MKRVLLALVLFCHLIEVEAQVSFRQRIAFPAMETLMSAKGMSKKIPSFCFDAARTPPSNLGIYKHVLLDGNSEVFIGNAAAITLSEAISRGFIEVVGNDYRSLQFRNMTDDQMRLVTKTPTLLGEIATDTRGVSKESVSITDKNDQKTIWALRKQAENEEILIQVLKAEEFLTTLDPSPQELLLAKDKFRSRFNIKADQDIEYFIGTKYYEIKRRFEQREKEAAVLLHEGIITKEIYDKLVATSDLNSILEYAKIYKAKYKITSDYDYRYKIDDAHDDIERYASLSQRKIELFQYAGYLDAYVNDPAVLVAAETKYKHDNNIKDLHSFNSRINQELSYYYSTQKALEILGEKDLQNNPLLVRKAEAEYLKRYNLTKKEANVKFEELYSTFLSDRSNTYKLINRYSTGDNRDNLIKSLQKELGFPVTGDLENPGFNAILSFYQQKFLFKSSSGSSGDLVGDIKAVKKSLRLEESLVIDEKTKKVIADLESALTVKGYKWSGVKAQAVEDGIMYMTVAPNYTTSRKIISYNPDSKQIGEIETFNTTYYSPCYVNKVTNSLYAVQDRLVTISELSDAIRSSDPFRDWNSIWFGKRITETDAQSIIRTAQIKNILVEGEDIGQVLKVTSDLFDFSKLPAINVEVILGNSRAVNFGINRLKNPVRKGGVVANVLFRIYDISTLLVERVKGSIRSVFTRAKLDPAVDFASELKKDLKRYKISMDSFTATWKGVDVTMYFLTSDDHPTYCAK